MEKWKKFCSGIGKDRFLIMIIGGLLLLVITYPLPAEKSGQKTTDDQTKQEQVGSSAGTETVNEVTDTQSSYEKNMEARLEEILSDIYGAGKVEVFISFSDYGTNIVEKDTSYTRDNEEREDGEAQKATNVSTENQEQTVYTTDDDGRQVPFVNRIKTPEVEGVLVVAQGGQESEVSREMKEAIMALFGIEEHKIKVVKMKGEDK